MPSLPVALIRAADLPDPRLARTLWQWLALGLATLALLPAARGSTLLLGYAPFWLFAPALALLLVHRHALVAAWRARLVRATPRRRRRSLDVQARRSRKPARPGLAVMPLRGMPGR
ncbi:hypothetical protein [Arenimonas sp. MALMAid1274]|uniref:hypothetical protein n=1 Tax=Arenimonas sp. MALMAid1274 TaxID=3411630 RepID=UPI003BA2AC4A